MKDLVGWTGSSKKLNNADLDIWGNIIRRNIKGCELVKEYFQDGADCINVYRGSSDCDTFTEVAKSLKAVLGDIISYDDHVNPMGVRWVEMSVWLDDVPKMFYGHCNHKLCDEKYVLKGIDKAILRTMLTRILSAYLRSLGISGTEGSIKSLDAGTYIRYKFICDNPNIACTIANGFYPFIESVYTGIGITKYANTPRKNFGGVLEKVEKNNFEAVFSDCFDNYWYKEGDNYILNMEVIYENVIHEFLDMKYIRKELGSKWKYSMFNELLANTRAEWGGEQTYEEAIDTFTVLYPIPVSRKDLLELATEED